MTLHRSSVCHRRAFGLAFLVAGAAAAGQASSPAGSAAAIPQPVVFRIEAQPMRRALKEFASQSHLQLVYETADLDAVPLSPSIVGAYTPQAVLDRLLANTTLNYAFVNTKTISIKSAADSTATMERQAGNANSFNLAGESPANEASPAQSQNLPSSSDSNRRADAKRRESTALEEVVVTGSRLAESASGGPQEIKIYTREQIDQSGQNSISDFLNTIPAVSNASVDNGLSVFAAYGQTTVQLHGLPIGTTLVLLDGRRLESSGLAAAPGQPNSFDLNNLPLDAVERIEVLSEGSSAIYGSDAIAGVVNIILKSHLRGLSVSAKFGGAPGTNETVLGLAGGHDWDLAHIDVIASVQKRTGLSGSERSLTADQNFTRFGGADMRVAACNPGNVFSLDGTPLPGSPNGETFAALSPTSSASNIRYGALNLCSLTSGFTYITPVQREAVVVKGSYDVAEHFELFAQSLFSHSTLDIDNGSQFLYSTPSFTQYSIPATYPSNPFGKAVGIGYAFADLPHFGTKTSTNFFEFAAGLRGHAGNRWHWEVSGSLSHDYNRTNSNGGPYLSTQTYLDSATSSDAVNFFSDQPLSSAARNQMLANTALADNRYFGRSLSATAFVRGDVIHIPAGPVQIAVGSEYTRDNVSYDFVSGYFVGSRPQAEAQYNRSTISAFLESRIPLLGNGLRDTLALTLAGRFDKYYNSTSKFTPQIGVEVRPVDVFSIRANYAKAFKAPSLFELYSPATNFIQPIVDPKLGTQYTVSAIQGGNFALAPEAGRSISIGVAARELVAGLNLSTTYWEIVEDDSIQTLLPQSLVDNEDRFPGQVTRAPGSGGMLGQIVRINDSLINFGEIRVRGIDYSASYAIDTKAGRITPSLSAAQTLSYLATLLPGAPGENRTSKASDDGNWAPRWKAVASANWRMGTTSASLTTRYTGRYQDYDSSRYIGNFFLTDANVHYSFRRVFEGARGLQDAYVEVGGINIFNTRAQFSNYGFGFYGYDPAQADLRGRFLYIRLGAGL